MIPILFTLGNFTVSSFGLFLSLGIFLGAFTIWRITQAYEFDAEKVLDLIFLTIGAGFIFSRLVFVLLNLSIFDNLAKAFFIGRYPGLSFWGGLIGGLLTLYALGRRNKIPFFQVGDVAIIGFFIAAFFGEIGCLLGACGVGVETASFVGVDQVGAIGKRLPIQAFEAIAFLLVFLLLWKAILRFHIQGSLFARGLMILGIIKLAAQFFKTNSSLIKIGPVSLNIDLIIPAAVFIFGVRIYYLVHKKTPATDLASIYRFSSSRNAQKSFMTKIRRGWYNQKANLAVRLGKGRKKLFKMLNIRSNPDSFRDDK